MILSNKIFKNGENDSITILWSVTMIFLPFLYKDEMLYSVFARYHLYSGNENTKTTMDDLFGSSNVCATTLFTTHLKSFCQNLPISDSYTPSDLITRHTCLPYYAPFIPNERYQELIMMMSEGTGTAFYMKLGKTASTIKSPKHLNFCSECIADDKSINGEAYLHRTHQMEGVKVCPIHKTWLIETDVPYAERKNKHEFISLERTNLHEESEGNMKTGRLDFEHLNFLSEQTHYLLNNSNEPLSLKKLNKFYVTRLQQKGLATVTGRVKWIDLIPKFNNYYGKKLLTDLNCFIEADKEDTWLHKLLRKPRVSCHPLRHILFLGFLRETISSMVNQINDIKYDPFGKGPWFCLNKAAEHYHHPVVTSCVITRDYKSSRPVGTFSCSCGFVYSRKGPDKIADDQYKIGRIKIFGPVWERRLAELAQDNLSLRKKADLLGVDPMTVKKKLAPTESGKIVTTNDTKRNEYRDKWIKLLGHHSEKSITDIRTLNQKVYTWLYRNDKEWLKNHYPGTQKIKTSLNKRVDWDQRDQETAKQVEFIAKEIITETSKLMRVTKNEIGRRLGELSTLYKNLDKMPKTKEILNEVIESVELFQVRRIKYIANHLRETNPHIKEWVLIRAAGLNKKYAEKHQEIIQRILL
jgi:hypothetical protein